MATGARTPEELDTLLEDAFVLGDRNGFHALFDDGALLIRPGNPEVRGSKAIGRALAELGANDCTYLSCPQQVLQARDTALIVAAAGTHVLLRGPDRAWRAAISLLELDINRNGDT